MLGNGHEGRIIVDIFTEFDWCDDFDEMWLDFDLIRAWNL